MEVPFEYLCLLALERLSKYENIRHIDLYFHKLRLKTVPTAQTICL